MGRVELRPTSGKKDDAAGGVDKYYIRLGLDPGKYQLVAAPLASGWSKYEYLQLGREFTFNRGQETYLG